MSKNELESGQRMKCPHCGNELDGKDVCAKCGGKVSMQEAELEVEYKDFKISEFLEIRKKQQKPRNGEPDIPAGVRKKQKGSHKSSGSGLSAEKSVKSATQEISQVTPGKKNSLMMIVIIVLIALAVIFGAYFLMRTMFEK